MSCEARAVAPSLICRPRWRGAWGVTDAAGSASTAYPIASGSGVQLVAQVLAVADPLCDDRWIV